MRGRAARALRADAERNRSRILEIAQEVFAAEGLSVRVEEIARRAGVGVGTIYRHFPTKDALLTAIVVDRLDWLAEHAEELAAAEDPGAALFALVRRVVDEGAAKKDLVEGLGGGEFAATVTGEAAATKRRFRKALAALLTRAQAAGAVRQDIDASDVLALVRGVLFDADATARARARRLGVLCDGLRRTDPPAPHRDAPRGRGRIAGGTGRTSGTA